MTQFSIHDIYPEAVWHENSTSDEHMLSFPADHGFWWINKTDLTDREIKLLTLLTNGEKQGHPAENHLWYQILYLQKLINSQEIFRVIQLHIKKEPDFLAKEWEENLKALFPEWQDFFYLDEANALLIEKYHENALNVEDLAGIFLTLDADFETNSLIFVGSFQPFSENFSQFFQEERQIFQTEQPQLGKQRVFGLADVALHYFTKQALSNSPLIRQIKQTWHLEPDMERIIETLWKEQGNVSSTAKILFMHRNTLQYRLDKFQEKSSLNLKKTNDLIFAYLLLMDE